MPTGSRWSSQPVAVAAALLVEEGHDVVQTTVSRDIHDLDGGQEIEREEGSDDPDNGSWDAADLKASRGQGDRDDDEENEIGRRGLEVDNS